MMRRRHLLDTNHMSAVIRQVSPVRDRIAQAHRAGSRFATCVPVLCELEVGIQQTADPDAYRRRLRHLLGIVRVWPLDAPLARVYGEVYHELRRQGRALSPVDRILAALARVHNVILLTTDRDFEALPDIRTENWVDQPPPAP
jgi:tRNA(fMet)-specific endonuclease VapC